MADAGGDSSAPTASGGPAPYGDPNLMPLFDGKTLTGWTASDPAAWTAMNGTIHGNGTSRGWLATAKDYADYRIVFSVIHLPTTGGNDHMPTILLFGVRMPVKDALGAIQFQPPQGYYWDYGAGGKASAPMGRSLMATMWSQCEVLAHAMAGTARMACCQGGGPAAPCKATEVVSWTKGGPAPVGPFALQVHNAGLHDEYKDIYIELNPMPPDKYITGM
jgi:hypothetical protein